MISKMDRKFRVFIINCLFISLGSALFAFGLQYFAIPNNFMEGGITGIALLLKYRLHISPWLTILIVNIPLLLATWKWTGTSGAAYTLVGGASFPIFLYIAEIMYYNLGVPPFQTNQDDLLVAVIAGITTGAGLGIVLRYGGSTGGTVLVARLAHHLFGWRQGRVILFFDVLVIGISVLFIPMEKILYTLIMVFIASKVIDFVIQEAYSAKGITVFSQNPSLLAEHIKAEMERGLTLYQAKGGYTGNAIEVIYCVVSRSEVHRFKGIVKQLDPTAFLIVHDVQEVLGEGFWEH